MLMESLGFPLSSKKVSIALEMSSEGQTGEGRPGASKEKHKLPEKFKGKVKYHKDSL